MGCSLTTHYYYYYTYRADVCWYDDKLPALAGKAKAGMAHSVSGCTRGVQLKLWDSLRTRAIPERLRGVFTTRRYTNPSLPYFTLPVMCTERGGFDRASMSTSVLVRDGAGSTLDSGSCRWSGAGWSLVLLAWLWAYEQAVQGQVQTRQSRPRSHRWKTVSVSVPGLRQGVRQVREPQDSQANTHRYVFCSLKLFSRFECVTNYWYKRFFLTYKSSWGNLATFATLSWRHCVIDIDVIKRSLNAVSTGDEHTTKLI